MTDTNYTPDEIRLLDEFAKALTGPMFDARLFSPDEPYATAAAMIAERRKRVPYTTVTEASAQGNAQGVYTAPVAPLTVGAHVAPLTVGITPSPTTTVTTAPVAQPEPEREGELTEEAVQELEDVRYVGIEEIDRAVVLMREGLRAKESLAQCKAQHSATYQDWKRAEKERDEARGSLDSLRNFLDAPDCKLPVGRVIQLVKDLRADLDEARARLRPDEPCRGCQGCGSNDCPDALDIANYRAEKAESALSAIIKKIDKEALSAGVLAEADYRREEVCEENAIEVLDRLSELLGQYSDDSRSYGEVDCRLREVIEWQDEWTFYDAIDALVDGRKRAEAALAEVQPVLDAVMLAFPDDGDGWEWDEDYNTFLQAYADRRREQQREGGAK